MSCHYWASISEEISSAVSGGYEDASPKKFQKSLLNTLVFPQPS